MSATGSNLKTSYKSLSTGFSNEELLSALKLCKFANKNHIFLQFLHY